MKLKSYTSGRPPFSHCSTPEITAVTSASGAPWDMIDRLLGWKRGEGWGGVELVVVVVKDSVVLSMSRPNVTEPWTMERGVQPHGRYVNPRGHHAPLCSPLLRQISDDLFVFSIDDRPCILFGAICMCSILFWIGIEGRSLNDAEDEILKYRSGTASGHVSPSPCIVRT